ncbi:hypothetical protein Afil01_29680 [Actinorhabdospora filicis]|uniref:Serine/threonine protein kinase n=1 Tax=Actinorhabdospora filicis TaxID=1785913 RepID=A0A9W6SP46_9ACTN|nr:protein kinase [Actinorhabdospora filicis]GLZ78161.1 hypothetical protein Afil01_29680 [Actinorhabdospora filicis]
MAAKATVTLTLLKGHGVGSVRTFDERTTCVLGRSSDCDPRLPDDDAHRTVSRHHCLIDINPPEARIRDFGSLNGTYVNGVKVGQRQAHQTPQEAAALSYPEHDLSDGDEIRVGDTVFRVGVHVPHPLGTLSLSRCVRCDREVGSRLGAEPADYICAACQDEPAAVLGLMLDLAQSGRHDLAPIAGYTMLRELGRGGMGAVYLARHEESGREVALKLMLPRVAASREARARFLREAELTRTLRHPNIVALHETGTAEGAFFFTSEYCPGGSLDRLLDRAGGRLPVDEAVRLARQALDGLAHAHERGIVHRDLSPHNILLDHASDGTTVAKIADFGLAKAFDQAGLSGLTRTGTAAGKPWYMPRQQVLNFRNASPAVDVWALAACLYQAISGALPRDFARGRDPWQTVLQSKPVPIRDREPSVPPALAEVIDEALREHSGNVYGDAAAMGRALAAVS